MSELEKKVKIACCLRMITSKLAEGHLYILHIHLDLTPQQSPSVQVVKDAEALSLLLFHLRTLDMLSWAVTCRVVKADGCMVRICSSTRLLMSNTKLLG
jgi:hypothetical protein